MDLSYGISSRALFTLQSDNSRIILSLNTVRKNPYLVAISVKFRTTNLQASVIRQIILLSLNPLSRGSALKLLSGKLRNLFQLEFKRFSTLEVVIGGSEGPRVSCLPSFITSRGRKCHSCRGEKRAVIPSVWQLCFMSRRKTLLWTLKVSNICWYIKD